MIILTPKKFYMKACFQVGDQIITITFLMFKIAI